MKIGEKEIEKLANLARIKFSEEEKKELGKDIESILGYVSEIQKVSLDISTKVKPLSLQGSDICNVMREDTEPHKSGIYTEKILNEAPKREGDYVKVKKIL